MKGRGKRSANGLEKGSARYRERRKEQKKTTSASFLSTSWVYRVYPLEQCQGNLIPFSIYLNPLTQTRLRPRAPLDLSAPCSSSFSFYFSLLASLPPSSYHRVPLFLFRPAFPNRMVSLHPRPSGEKGLLLRLRSFPPTPETDTSSVSWIRDGGCLAARRTLLDRGFGEGKLFCAFRCPLFVIIDLQGNG